MSDSITRGRKKLFQIWVNWKRKMVTKPGAIIGRPILQKVLNSPAPSTRAASRTSLGMYEALKTRARYTPNGKTRPGMNTPQKVFTSPALAASR